MTNSAGVRAPRHGCNVPPFRQGTRIATPVCALARNDMQKLARCQRLQGRYSLPPVIARSEATWQSVLLAAVQNEKEYFWRIRKALRIRPRQCQLARLPCGETDCRRCAHWCAMTNSAGVRAPRHGCNVPPFRQGTRIATPVCALARNDMQKLARCQRLQGRYSLPPVIARSEATWQSVLLAAVQNEKEYFWRIRKALRIRPRQCQLARLPCGETDCHTSSPQSPPCPAPLGLLSPQRVPLCGAPCTGSQ